MGAKFEASAAGIEAGALSLAMMSDSCKMKYNYVLFSQHPADHQEDGSTTLGANGAPGRTLAATLCRSSFMPGKTANAGPNPNAWQEATGDCQKKEMPQDLQLHLVDYDDSSSNLGVTYFRMLHFLMS